MAIVIVDRHVVVGEYARAPVQIREHIGVSLLHLERIMID